MTALWYSAKFVEDLELCVLSEILKSDTKGAEVWSALANVTWHHADHGSVGFTFRQAGDMIADMLDRGSYLDWYCSGPSGVVSEWIASSMAALGWTYSDTNDDDEIMSIEDVFQFLMNASDVAK